MNEVELETEVTITLKLSGTRIPHRRARFSGSYGPEEEEGGYCEDFAICLEHEKKLLNITDFLPNNIVNALNQELYENGENV